MKVYDFDKTIYAGDSTIDFYVYCLKKSPGLILYLPIQLWGGLLYVLGIYSKVRFKEKFFSFLIALDNREEVVTDFWVFHEDKIQGWYKKKKLASDVIISASPEFLLAPICIKLGVGTLIASKVDIRTGLYDGENCEGQHKVERLKYIFPNYEIAEFYSDSLSDAPLAELARRSYLVDGASIVLWDEYTPTRRQKIKRLFASKEFMGFLFIGAINAVNGVVFAYLYTFFFNVNTAFILGYLTSLTIAYILNSCIAFNEKLALLKYLKFCFSYIPNFVIQNAVVLIFYNHLGWYKLAAFVLAAFLGVPITFLLIKFFAFAGANNS